MDAARCGQIEVEDRHQHWRDGFRLLTAAPVHMPMPLQLAMEQHVKSAVLLQGDRALPQAGLLFFEYRGKAKTIRSVELIYAGFAGKATLPLQP